MDDFTKQAIEAIFSGNSSEMKDAIESSLGDRVASALASKKQEVAGQFIKQESTNPFSKDYKSQMQSKPGEKTGHDSKKISTGTVYTKKAKKDDEKEKDK